MMMSIYLQLFRPLAGGYQSSTNACQAKDRATRVPDAGKTQNLENNTNMPKIKMIKPRPWEIILSVVIEQ